MKCTCGQPAVHTRQVDGKTLTLCGECNAVLHCIVHNYFGVTVLRAARINCKAEDDTFLKLAAMAPVTYTPVEVKPPPAVRQSDGARIQYDPFVPPLPVDFNEMCRMPPEMPNDITDSVGSTPEGDAVVGDTT